MGLLEQGEFYEKGPLREYLAERRMNLRSNLEELQKTLIGLDFEGEYQPTKINNVFRKKRKIYLEIEYPDGGTSVFEASKSGKKYVRRKLK